jgi:RNA:NAD 2'-phosphotransferase (TPT1/KptA family)
VNARKNPTHIVLSAKLSRVLAGTLRHTPDVRDIDAARREMRTLAIEQARAIIKRDPFANVPVIEVYSCKRYGGSLLDVVTL